MRRVSAACSSCLRGWRCMLRTYGGAPILSGSLFNKIPEPQDPRHKPSAGCVAGREISRISAAPQLPTKGTMLELSKY